MKTQGIFAIYTVICHLIIDLYIIDCRIRTFR